MTDRGAAGESKGEQQIADDRRESLRVPIQLLVRDPALGGSFEERRGNLALGGVYFSEGHPPHGNQVEIRFVIPGTRIEVQATGEILRLSRDSEGFGAHVKFRDLPLETELAIARFLQNQ
jgi:hypothetical protein